MEREELVNKIISFCFTYGVLDETVKMNEIQERIDKSLNQCEFIEDLYNMILLETKSHKKMDIGKIQELLLELEKIRLELEYKESTTTKAG